MELQDQIDEEVRLYLAYCKAALRHDEWEQFHRAMAHSIYYHIVELRSTKVCSPLGGM